MTGVMILTFIIFFAFVVNVGTLVNAKINLQNAADLAAYAGAATQARQMNHVSYINYEMRRQYKKFLLRYYVIGNMAQIDFPKTPKSFQQSYKWSPDKSKQYGVPAVCITFKKEDNYCQRPQLNKIDQLQPNPLEPINNVLSDQLRVLEEIREKHCGTVGLNNRMVLTLWLYNSDPTLKDVSLSQGLSQEQKDIIGRISALSQGLGLVPREILLKLRADSIISKYLNHHAEMGVDIGRANLMKTGADPAANERTVQAFLSAYYTLGDHMFGANSVKMDELLPSNIFEANPVQVDFDTYSVDYLTPSDNSQGDCVASLNPIPVHRLPVGLAKNPRTLTYYAVKLTAKAQLMFDPFNGGEVELRAYAAAQPFGSRIGPGLSSAEGKFTYPLTPKTSIDPMNAKVTFGLAPGLALLQNSAPSPNEGFATEGALGTFFSTMSPGNGEAYTISHFDSGIAAAMAPNPAESGQYNIPSDINVGGAASDGFVRFFDTNGDLAFWAPVVTPDDLSLMTQRLTDGINGIFNGVTPAAGSNPQTGQVDPKIKQALIDSLIKYSANLQAPNPANPTEGNETLNIIRITDPSHYRPLDPIHPGTPAIAIPILTLTDPLKLKTSFSQINDSDLGKFGRTGYSVKFVSFDSFLRKLTTNGADQWSNDPILDSDAQQDFKRMHH